MNVSHASVHPVEDPPPTDAINAPRVRMKDFQGTPRHHRRALASLLSVSVCSNCSLCHGHHQ
ncbi:hypothetical protein CK203_074170 [Vitis vinifera]|uniref:Uncharacterized protein n=1 Tax=Vitis vinifera TaxID=29760 RepID=A0A438DTV7_VITVI|nr:hypothetical protein CK203_074170 [Vitis vinifera]